MAFRLPQNMVERLDAYADRLGHDGSGLRYTRTDALRLLVGKSLTAEGLPEKTNGRRVRQPTRRV